jgi:DNA-binding IclR family transcriptional regulator
MGLSAPGGEQNPASIAHFRYIKHNFDMSKALPGHRAPDNYAEYGGDRHFATTLARGLELLRCFNPQEQWLGNRQLSDKLGLPAATVSRLTYTLMGMGYLVQAEPYGKYRLGSAVLSLGYPLLEYFPMRRRARPLMQRLADETGGSVSIAIRDRFNMVYIEVVRSSSRRVYPLDVGTSQSLAGSAIGRAYLMSCPMPERQAVINQIKVKAPDQWARFGKALSRSLNQYPKLGCCVSLGEIYSDVQAIAVPLGRIDHGEFAALNCSFQGLAMDEPWLLKTVLPKLLALSKQIT